MPNTYNDGLRRLADGTIQWGVSDMRAMCVTNGYTYDADHEFLDEGGANDPVDEEITNVNYARVTLANEIVIVDNGNNEVQLDADPWTWTNLAAGDQPFAIIVYLFNALDTAAPMLSYNALTAPPAPNGGDYTINPDAEGLVELSN